MILLSFDIEEFDMPFEYERKIDFIDQINISIQGTNSILDILKKHQVKATFFSTATFAINAEVGGQSAETIFYTSSGSTDYPNDLIWAEAISTILNGFVGISDVIIDLPSNRITIKTNCEEISKNCGPQTINPLQEVAVWMATPPANDPLFKIASSSVQAQQLSPSQEITQSPRPSLKSLNHTTSGP